jgi:transcriptional regulator with XRE-family HTH domain|tara:strand:+ start:247 stop:447 length:201 start_codon:yes stop_codon:yes gene_type:complete
MTLSEYLDVTSLQQIDISKSTEYSPATISRWISGDRTPSRSAIQKVHKITMGVVTFDDWMSEDDRR